MAGVSGSTAAVLGCGVIGGSWIEAFLSRGLRVRAWDPFPQVARERYADALNADQLIFTDTAGEAVSGSFFVQESGPEDLDRKRQLYREIAPYLPGDAIVASSTSTLQPSQLQEGCAFAERVLIGHPFNPPHILPLVEVVGGRSTDPAAIAAAMEFYSAIGKRPIRLNSERPGHLANRLQAALWCEAVDAVASGQASVTDVDDAVRLALGPRWALMGPFATFHLGGGNGGMAHFLDHLGPAFEGLWDDARRPQMTDALRAKIVEGIAQSLNGQSADVLIRVRDEKLHQILTIAQGD